MFVNQSKLVALESIFYQNNDGNMHKLKKVNKDALREKNPLGIDEYEPTEGDTLSAFCQKGETFKPQKEDFVKSRMKQNQKSKKDKKKL